MRALMVGLDLTGSKSCRVSRCGPVRFQSVDDLADHLSGFDARSDDGSFVYGQGDSGRPTTRQVRRMLCEPETAADTEVCTLLALLRVHALIGCSRLFDGQIPATTRNDSDSDEGEGTGELSWMPDSDWVDVDVDLDMEIGDGQPRLFGVTDCAFAASEVLQLVGEEKFDRMLQSQKPHRHLSHYQAADRGGVGAIPGERAGVVGWKVGRLRSGTRHVFRVRAENAVGGGLYSRPSRMVRVPCTYHTPHSLPLVPRVC